MVGGIKQLDEGRGHGEVSTAPSGQRSDDRATLFIEDGVRWVTDDGRECAVVVEKESKLVALHHRLNFIEMLQPGGQVFAGWREL